jgi:SAM-dependent methyltransferase
LLDNRFGPKYFGPLQIFNFALSYFLFNYRDKFNMIKKTYSIFKYQGIRGLFYALFSRILPRRLVFYKHCRSFFKSKTGLEIGGPSSIFRRTGLIPVYTVAARIDNCNFGNLTIWEGKISEGDTFYFDKRRAPGRQYIAEASNLCSIASASYDFILSSHCLEHIANPLQALAEWTRVLKEEGVLVIVIPHRDGTFDHHRPITSLEHLIQDFDQETTEGDMTHLEEILTLHDLSKDPGGGDFQTFKQRSMLNRENRCLHHHVFNCRLAVEMVHHAGLKILSVELFRPFHIIVIGQKLKPGQKVKNDCFRGIDTEPCWFSPFPSDRPLIQKN